MDRLSDLLAALSLMVLLVAGLWIAHGLGLPTGGAELLEARP